MYLKLTDLGVQVKKTGGYFAYLEKITEKETAEKQRQERRDKTEEVDLKLKKWLWKTKIVPYIVSIGALTISIFAYFKPEKKQPDLRLMQQEILQLKSEMNKLNSLYPVDTLQTKNTR